MIDPDLFSRHRAWLGELCRIAARLLVKGYGLECKTFSAPIADSPHIASRGGAAEFLTFDKRRVSAARRPGIATAAMPSGVQPSPQCAERTMRDWLNR